MRGSQPRTARPLRVVRPLAPVDRFLLPPEIGQPPPEIVAGLRAIAERVRLLTRAHLLRANAETGGDIERMTEAVDTLGAELAAAYAKDFAAQKGRDADLAERLSAVECRKGCTFCCHMNVGVTALEAARIAATLRRGTNDARYGAVLAADDRFERRGAQERLKLKTLCPLLVAGACSVYELRPLACRALLSLSARLCELELEAREAGGAAQVPTLVMPRLIAA